MRNVDILNREKFVEDLVAITENVLEQNESRMFAINGAWGSGKSYVLDMFEERIEKIQSEVTNDDKYFVFHYNCWEYDYYEEPIIAIVASILDTISKKEKMFGGKEDIWIDGTIMSIEELLKDIAGEFIKNKIGIDLVGLSVKIKEAGESVRDEREAFDTMATFKESINRAREQLMKIAEYKSVVWVVDELDRCLPAYAIKVLERLHHLLKGIPNMVIIIAMDQEQIKHSIDQIFGSGDKADQYLKKFIDFSLELDTGIISDEFYDKYGGYFDLFQEMTINDKDKFKELFYALFDKNDIRTQEKIMENVELIHRIINGAEEKRDPALMWFETMWFGLRAKTGESDFSWIFDSNMASKNTYNLDKGLLTTLQNMTSGIARDSFEFIGDRRKSVLSNESIIDRVYWLWDKVLRREMFILNEEHKYQKEENCAEKFMELAERLMKK